MSVSILLSFVGGAFGAILGSFSTAMIHRIPRNVSFIKSKNGAERSKCTSCEHVLCYLDLVPVLSWLLLHGKCRYCKKNIGTSYFLVEFFSAIIGAVTLSLSLGMLFNLYFFAVLPFLITFIILFFRYRDLYMVRFLGFIIVGLSVCALVTKLFLSSYS